MRVSTLLLSVILPLVSGSKGVQKAKIFLKASGAQEVPPVESDTSATLTLKFAEDFSYMDYKLNVFNGKAITQAHLHCGKPGANGPSAIFVLFESKQEPGTDFDGKAEVGRKFNENILDKDFEGSEECGHPIPNLAALYGLMEMGMIYLNVHSEENPPGEVRAHIFPSLMNTFP